MRKIVFVAALVIFGLADAWGQVSPQFQTIFTPTASNCAGEGIMFGPNGEVYTVASEVNGSPDGVLVSRMSSTGTIDWTKKLSLSNGNFAGARWVAPVGTSFIGLGNANNTQNAPLVFSFDNAGNLNWAREILIGTSAQVGRKLLPTSDGGFILTANRYNGSNTVSYVIKMTATGTLSWAREISHPTGDVYDAWDFVEIPSGGYYLTCTGYDVATSQSKSWVFQLSSIGNLVNQAALTTIAGESFNPEGITLNTSGGVLVCGYYSDGTGGAAGLVELDPSLNVTQAYKYSAGTSFFLRFIIQDPNSSGYIGIGPVSDAGFGGMDVGIVKLDASLNIAQGMIYGTPDDDDPLGALVLPSGSVMAACYKGDPAMPGNESALYLGTDPALSTGCAEGAITPTRATINISGASSSLNVSTTSMTVNTFTPLWSSETMNQNQLCFTQGCNMSLSGTVTDDDCGTSNGAIDLTVTGGTSPFTYSWSNGASTEDISGLSGGSYSVDVTDQNGCVETMVFTVGSGTGVGVSNVVITDVTCNGGSDGAIDVTISGGTSPYTYSWTGPNSFSASTQDISGLEAGSYNFVVVDANGCDYDNSYTVGEPSAIQTMIISSSDVSCSGGSDGEATALATGGDGNFSYQWDAAAGNQTGATATGLGAGTYSVTATDGNGCTGTVSVTISEPAPISVSDVVTHVLCNGQSNGSIDLTVTGGTSPYSYQWSNGPTSQDITGLTAGTYSVTITDNNGCTTNGTYTVTQPAALSATINVTDVSCNGLCDGEVTANPTGGTSPYQYSWSDPSNQTTQTATGLCPGTFNVNISDANNCQVTPSATVGEPAALVVSATGTASECNQDNGAATAVASGGTSPYTYSWSSGGTASTETNLGPGTYTVNVTDANGCSGSASTTVNDTTYGVDVCVATVDTTSSHNIVVWTKPSSGYIDGFNVYRDIVGTYTQVGFVPYDSLSEFVDTTNNINPNTTSYRYKISVVDTCGNESELSDFHETIHLTVSQGAGGVWNLIWDNYIGVNFAYYRIMRDTIGNDVFVAIDSVTNANTTYTDNSPGQSYSNYRIDIVLNNPCQSTRANNHNTTRSNRYNPANPPNGIQEQSMMATVNVYPNPNTGDFTLAINSTIEGQAQIEMYDVNGRLVMNSNIRLHRGKTNYPIALEGVETGYYFLILHTRQGQVQVPVQVLR